MEVSDIVLALAGRDKGGYFLIVGADDSFLYIADGRSRKVESPKRKKRMHLQFEAKCAGIAAEKLKSGAKASNNEIRRALNEFFTTAGEGLGR